jgi:hypothetical protein
LVRFPLNRLVPEPLWVLSPGFPGGPAEGIPLPLFREVSARRKVGGPWRLGARGVLRELKASSLRL